MEKKRLQYLDEIKGASILLVVFCHSVLLPSNTIIGNILMLIAWGAVPCFFMVTGSIYHNTVFFDWRKWKIRLAELYIILAIWKGIHLIYFILCDHVSFTKAQLIQFLLFWGDIENVSVGQLWFMYAYIMMMLFLPVSYYFFHSGKEGERILLFVLTIAFIGGLGLPSLNMIFKVLAKVLRKNTCDVMNLCKAIPFGSMWKNMLFYFITGAFLGKYHDEIRDNFDNGRWKKWWIYSSILIGVLGLMLIKFFQTGSFCWEGIYLYNGYDWISTGFVSIGIYLSFVCKLGNGFMSNCLQYIGKNTMGIYYMHCILADIYVRVWNIWLKGTYSVFFNILKTGIVVVACILVIKFVKKIPVIKKLV